MRKEPLICDSVFMLLFVVCGKWGTVPLITALLHVSPHPSGST